MPRRSDVTVLATDGRLYSYFKFDVTDWKFDYHFHLFHRTKGGLPLPMTNSEGAGVTLTGPLLRKTKRCGSVELHISSEDFGDLRTWEFNPDYDPDPRVVPKWKGFGGTGGVSRGVLRVGLRLPSGSFPYFLAALAAGRVQRAGFTIEGEVKRGKGLITSFTTIDPEEVADDE